MTFEYPEGFSPADASVHTIDERAIAAPSEHVFAWLLRAPLWPSFYDNAKSVRLPDGAARLELGMEFSFRTFGVRVHTEVVDLASPHMLAWRGGGMGTRAWHAWSVTPTNEGCHVVTVETQCGVTPRLFGWALESMMHEQHARWLEGLERVALSGPPPLG